MHFAALLPIAGALLGLTNGASISPRLPRLGAFGSSTTAACPLVDPQVHEFAEGSEGNACYTFYNNATMRAIDVYYWDPQCLLTVYTTTDCSDSGIVSGPGCWAPGGGVSGYKVTCPYKTL